MTEENSSKTLPGGRRRGFKSWFVDPYRQVKLGLMFIIVNLVFAALIFGVFGYYIYDIYQSILSYFEISNVQAPEMAGKFSVPVIVSGALIFLFVVVTILISVRYTHQIYGPLVSIRRFLDDLVDGKSPSPLQLRQSDQLKEVANKLNAVGERLGDGRIQAPLMGVHRFLDQMIEGKTPDPLTLRDSDNMRELVEKLNTLAATL
ncbi:hypothetical protein N9D31_00360, partial [Oligoflexaceae bacterium]|nr:hypothetical protein [Oligoflexaceae bacterium]